MSNWKIYKLEEIAKVQTGPFGSQLHQSDYIDIGTPIITVEHLGDNRIRHDNTPKVSDEDKLRLSKYWLCEGDIVFSRVGSVDRRAYVKKKEEGWLFSGRCLRVRPKRHINGKYLSYFFGLEEFKKKIRGIAVGATMPSLNTSIMNNIEVILPDETTQTKIARILSSLDDKIELNLQMNQTLEAIAQAIFKEWFVYFNFPGFDGELVDGLPKGWRMGKVKDVYKTTSGGTPSRTKPEFYENGKYDYTKFEGDK
ncbi:MAG TPA: restriction endonuclease subunit S, partial [Candidatus Cloacimonadota bacterium]|nr:restriction endonuclease subunit S [Candidatus Cloacimonadota bacterium]